MKKMIDDKVVNDVTTKKKYVKPEIEAIVLDEQPKLLVDSPAYSINPLHREIDD